ncbi:F-box/WD repeat-containing protein 8 [Osmerus eperlanus]|uniref:F-box/WD repeat-containing protein 8 n=1 Tax=Osmerus eperlanus TaxID=29151 RepID=UPI002E0FB405
MAEDELLAFRESWKQELTSKSNHSDSPAPRDKLQPSRKDCKNSYFEDFSQSRSQPETGRHDAYTESPQRSSIKESSPRSPSLPGNDGGLSSSAGKTSKDQPQYVSIAEGLLHGRTSPLMDRIHEERMRRKRQSQREKNSMPTQPQSKVKKSEKLVDQFIQDLNEVNDIPFFDVELPYELALKIFRYLNRTELGRCAQVSKAWGCLAEDSVLWYKLCQKEGYHREASVSDSPSWKSTLRDCKLSDHTVCSNWKNRVGSISQLQFELGKILCDVSSCDNFVVAGYTSGDVRLWDTLHWDCGASYLRPRSLACTAAPRPQVTLVQVNRTLAAAAYLDDCVEVWSAETGGEPVFHYQSVGRVHALALSPDSPTLASATGVDVRLDQPDQRGYWRTLVQARLPKPVERVVLVPGQREQPLAVLSADDSAFTLSSRHADPRLLHCVYGHPVTCLDASNSQAALGLKSSGWAMHDGGNKVQVYRLETGQAEVRVGSSAGDFTCICLGEQASHLLTCGNKDRRVRVFDLRTGSSVASLYAHHMGVTSVLADDWKIVSGGGEGLVCVWEMRMGAKLWEMHNRHPVRHVRFTTSTLVTANIPDEKSPRGACITDDDLTAHRRHRGVICHYDFSEDSVSQEHVLPICRSNYAESSGYNYNIGLAVPYDILSGSHPSH